MLTHGNVTELCRHSEDHRELHLGQLMCVSHWLDWNDGVALVTVQSSSNHAPLLDSQLMHLAGLRRSNTHVLGQNIMLLLFGESIAPRAHHCRI